MSVARTLIPKEPAMKIWIRKTVLCIALAAMSTAALAQNAADHHASTARGTSFIIPAGWTQSIAGNDVLLAPPEAHGSRVAIIDASSVSPDAAVAEAWRSLGQSPKLLVASDDAPRNGWDQGRYYSYDIADNAHRAVQAIALRSGANWTLMLVDVDQGIAEKRLSQLIKIGHGLMPAGYSPETFAGHTAHRLDAARLAEMVRFVEAMRLDYDVPGVAIGIVQDGKVVMSKGFGVRQLGKPAVVDGDTRFMIASNTKALTTLMLAKLVDAGKLDWNAKVTDVYPAFKLGNAETTRQVRVKHLICACTGVPRQDMESMFEGEKQTPDSVIATLGTMQPTSGFGELFQYSNPMAAAAGFIGGQVAYPGTELGPGYDHAMQSLVFDPLHMDHTTFDYARAQSGDFSSPHGYDIDHRMRVMSMDLNDNIRASRPDGGAWSTVNDMLKYVEMEIDRGKLPGGKQYIGEAALMQRRVPQVALGVDKDYAMGLIVDRSDGVTVVDHGGDVGGFHSNMMWWPDQGVGAVILTNSNEGALLRGPFKRRLMELMFDGKPQAEAAAALGAKSGRDEFAAQRKLLQWPADAHAIAGLASHYRSPALGDLVVTRHGEQAIFDVGAFRSVVATRPQADGSTAFVMVDPQAFGMTFVRADAAGKRHLIVRDGQHEYGFDEVK